MAHEINGIRLYVAYWTLDKNYEIGKGSKVINKIFEGVSCSDAMNQYSNFSYNHDLSKYSATQIVYIEEI